MSASSSQPPKADLPEPGAQARPSADPLIGASSSPRIRWVFGIATVIVFTTAAWFVWRYLAMPDLTVTVFPQRIHVASGGKTLLQANVSGSRDTDVDWSIREGNTGGQITPQGATMESGELRAQAIYQAPARGGTFHVIAASHAVRQRTATAEIVVTESQDNELATPSPSLNPSSIPSPGPSEAAASPAANPLTTQILGTWRWPTGDLKMTIHGNATVTVTSDSDPHVNMQGQYHFSGPSNLEIDFGNGDVRTWEVLGVDAAYLRVVSHSAGEPEAKAMVFSKVR